MTKELDSILEDCLSHIKGGKATISSSLVRHPAHASELEPLLLAAEEMWAIPKPVLSSEARTAIEARLMGAVTPRTETRSPARPVLSLPSNLRWAAVAFGAILSALLLVALLVNRVGQTLPGSPLHPAKLALEETWLRLAPAHEKPKLQLRYARRRLDEVAALNGQGAVDPALVDAMTQKTEAALTVVEELPPEMAVPLVHDLKTLIQDQKQTLATMLHEPLETSQEEVAVALQVNAEQESRAQVLQSSLPMPPALTIVEMVTPRSVPEPGAVVDFSVRITNDGAEDVTLVSLTNKVRGNPNGQGACSIPAGGVRLEPGSSYQCGFTAFVFLNAGEAEVDSVSATAVDDEGNEARVSATAAVTVVDVLPSIAVSKTADPSTVPEPGDTVQFAVSVRNAGAESVVLTSLVDDMHGDLSGQGTCLVPPGGLSLNPDDLYGCSFNAYVSGNAGESELDTVTAVAGDDEGNMVKAGSSATVVVTDVLPEIAVDKTADPGQIPEPGGMVQFVVRVMNNSVESVSLTALVDDVYGDLNGKGTCSVPRGGLSLGVGQRYECAFSAGITGNAGESKTDSVVAFASDDEGHRVHATGSATVLITDVLPTIAVSKTTDPARVPEPGATVEFTVQMSNNSVEDVVFASLVDDVHGNLNGQGTCVIPRGGIRLSPGGLHKCTYSADVTGNAGYSETGTVTVIAADDEGNRVKTAASTTVTVTDVVPEIAVDRTATPDRVPEPGAAVEFTVKVINQSVEAVKLTSLIDDTLGNLNGRGTCYVPQMGMNLAVGGSYQCAFTSSVLGNAGDRHADAVTAVAADDEGNRAKAEDSAIVRITDVLPTIAVSKMAAPTSVPEPGNTVEFAVRVRNTSVEDVTLTSLIDDPYGNLEGKGTCSMPREGITVPVAGTYECAFEVEVAGNAGHSETSTLTAEALDDEQNIVRQSGAATVTILDVLPTIEVVSTASPTSVPEPGDTVEFSVLVRNTSVEDVVLSSLLDEAHGDLNGQGTCSIPRSGRMLSPGGSYKCTFITDVTGNAGDTVTDIVTAKVRDDEGNAAEAAGSTGVRITDVLPAASVSKSAEPGSVPEPGDMVEFAVRVRNDSVEKIKLVSLVDDVHGNLDGQGTCVLGAGGTSLDVGAAYACTFSAEVAGNAGESETSVVTAQILDDEGNRAQASASATVNVTDVPPSITVSKKAEPNSLPEPSGVVKFTVSVANRSREGVTLTSLVDDAVGDLNGKGTCSLPPQGITISSAGVHQCAFTVEIAGNAGDSKTNAVTAQASDDEGNQTSASGSATVTISDVQPAIAVSKTADPTSLPEPGGVVQFTVLVTNNSVERVTLISLVDDVHGNLEGLGTCSLTPEGVGLAPGASYGCAFSTQVAGNAGQVATDTVTAGAVDDEGNLAEATASATVTITDVPPTIGLSQTASPSSVPEPGGTVQFMVRVVNEGIERVVLTSLVDDIHGDLNGQGGCVVPPEGTALGPAASYECTFSAEVAGNAGESQTSTVTATAADDEGNQAQASASATVSITDVPPVITVSETANPDSLPEPGGTVQFTVLVFSGSAESITLVALVDDVGGDLGSTGMCSIPPEGIVLGPGASFECTFSLEIMGSAGYSETDRVRGIATDDEGNRIEAAGSATVTISKVPAPSSSSAAGLGSGSRRLA